MKKSNQSTLKMRGDASFHITNYIVLGIATLFVLYPLIYVLVCSFSDSQAIAENQVFLWPVGFNVDGYTAIWENGSIVSGYYNAIIYTIGATSVGVGLLLLCAYPLSRRDLPHKKLLTLYFMITMFFNGGIITNYLLVRNLHMMNTRWSLIIPFVFSAYNMLIVRSYFASTIPETLLEAAHIDGCHDVFFFFKIAIPLAKPVIAVMILLNAVGHWNGYVRALFYLSDKGLYPLQLVLREILFQAALDDEFLKEISDDAAMNMANYKELIKYSVIIVGSVPLLMLYPFIQKYFVKGVMIGSIKE